MKARVGRRGLADFRVADTVQIFQPAADQRQVFEEISLLAQSVCDGYNVSCDRSF